MAKKSVNTTRKSARGSRKGSDMDTTSDMGNMGSSRRNTQSRGVSGAAGILSNFGGGSGKGKGMFMELTSNPAFRYVVGGIATAVLAKVATNIADRYPEISNFLKENLDTIEERLTEFKGNLEDQDTAHYS